MSLDTNLVCESEARDAASTCVVVLGSGRSGTSLATQILSEIGVRLNHNPGSKSDQNPDGLYEDEFIVRTHKELLASDRVQATLPLPPQWAAGPAARSTAAKLTEYIRAEFGSESLWGFKDPRTAMLILMWKRIFNRERVVPKYVLCVRDPSAVVHSMSTNYHNSQSDAELIWLSRNLAALRDTGLNCFILHYEKLFSAPVDVVIQLAEYICGRPIDQRKAAEIAQRCVKSNLDRSIVSSVTIENPLVPHLMSELSKCEGQSFDRGGLATAVQYCDRILKAVAQKSLEQQINISRIQEKNEQLEAQAVRLRRQIVKMQKDLAQLEKLRAELEQKGTDVQRLRAKRQRELAAIRSHLLPSSTQTVGADLTVEAVIEESQPILELARVGECFKQITEKPLHRRLVKATVAFCGLMRGKIPTTSNRRTQ